MPPVVDWGLRPYPEALAEMRRLRRLRREGAIGDTLIVVEHPSVITVGVQGDDGEEFPEGVPVVHVERGGKSTYHGPGQLVGYPIVDLDPRGHDVRRFVGDLEDLLVEAIAPLGVRGERVAGRRGVWVDGSRKVASVGIAVEDWVTFHGFALNVSTDLSAFAAFHPCGFAPQVMTSLSRELARTVSIGEVSPRVRASWERRFELGALAPGPSIVDPPPASA